MAYFTDSEKSFLRWNSINQINLATKLNPASTLFSIVERIYFKFKQINILRLTFDMESLLNTRPSTSID